MLVRKAQSGDADAVAGVHVRTWQTAYRGLLPDGYLDSLQPEQRARRYDFATVDPAKPRTIVAVEGEAILGFATTVPREAGEGELSALHVDPSAWNRGAGKALIAAARAHLAQAGCGRAILWLLAGNTRADRFYRADGWLPDGTRRRDEVWGVLVDELRYLRPLP